MEEWHSLNAFIPSHAPGDGINSSRNPSKKRFCLASTQTSRHLHFLIIPRSLNNLHFSFNKLIPLHPSRCRSLKSLPSSLLLLSVPSPLLAADHHHHLLLLAQPLSFNRYFVVVTYLLRSSNSPFRFLAVATQTRTAALQVGPKVLHAPALRVRLSTAMASLSAATTMTA
jgi:hypothetical protein